MIITIKLRIKYTEMIVLNFVSAGLKHRLFKNENNCNQVFLILTNLFDERSVHFLLFGLCWVTHKIGPLWYSLRIKTHKSVKATYENYNESSVLLKTKVLNYFDFTINTRFQTDHFSNLAQLWFCCIFFSGKRLKFIWNFI